MTNAASTEPTALVVPTAAVPKTILSCLRLFFTNLSKNDSAVIEQLLYYKKDLQTRDYAKSSSTKLGNHSGCSSVVP